MPNARVVLIANDGWSAARALTDEFQIIKKQREKNCYERRQEITDGFV